MGSMNVTLKPRIVHALLFAIPVGLLFYLVYSQMVRPPFFNNSIHHGGCENIGIMQKISEIETVHDCDVLNRLYEVRVEGAPFLIPDSMMGKVRKWLQNKEDLIKDADRQKVIQITNKEMSTYI